MIDPDAAPSYEGIFNGRADRYERAMRRYPEARDEEFQVVVARLNAQPGEWVADLPCGGGYLARYLPGGVNVVGVDPSEAFASLGRRRATHPVSWAPLTELPLADGSVDAVVSLAGLHHARDLPEVFRSFRRVLRPHGRMVVADVERGSPAAIFLDGFVDRHNPQGHSGHYFSPDTAAALAGSGWEVRYDGILTYRWRYASVACLLDYLADLFGMEVGDDALWSEVVTRLDGRVEASGAASHRWSLRLIEARPTGKGA